MLAVRAGLGLGACDAPCPAPAPPRQPAAARAARGGLPGDSRRPSAWPAAHGAAAALAAGVSRARRRAPRRQGRRSSRAPASGAAALEVLRVAEAAARAAGAVIVEKVGAQVLRTKAHAADLLTAVDAECEDIIRGTVLRAFPGDAFLGEESVGSPEALAELLGEDRLWVVDPIDGTTNFVAGQPMSAVSIGVARGGELVAGVIYDPFRDELFAAAAGAGATLNGVRIAVARTDFLRDAVVASGAPPNPRSAAPCFRAMSALAPPRTRTVRLLGSAAINFAWVACGRLDAWFEPDLNVWDSAAGALLVREAGGRVTDCEGAEYALGMRPVCASNGRVHDELLDELRMARAMGLDEAVPAG